MSKEYDKIYHNMIRVYSFLKKIGMYHIPGIKSYIYNHYSNKAFKETKDELCRPGAYNGNKIVVSLTTYGERTKTVYKTIMSLVNQEMKPERLVLWLDENEYDPDTLPVELKKLCQEVDFFEISYCENLKSHKKYYYSVKECPNNIVVTADDDVYYPSSWLGDLYHAYLQYPECVCCTNAHKMRLTEEYLIDSYHKWEYLVPDEGPDMLLCPIGVGGVLYPPNVFHQDVLDKDFIIYNCLNGDDLWLRIMTLLNGVKVVHVNNYPYTFLAIKGSQKSALSKENVCNHKNDEQLSNILARYGEQVKKVLCPK